MKKSVPFFIKSILVLCVCLTIGKGAYANHILGMDLSYAWVSGNTYKITLVAYGDCGGTNFATLETAAPTICIYNGNTSVTTVTLTLQAPTTGTEITPVCSADIGMTTCTSTTLTIPGVKKFVYSGNYTLSTTSAVWRFIFNGYMGAGSVAAGRATALTNINTAGGASYVELVDTLNNLTSHNTNPVLTLTPTPYYCLNNADNYTPGAVDADGDSLRFFLVAGQVGSGSTSCTVSGTAVTYLAGYSATAPLATAAGSFLFDPTDGQLAFNPNLAQRSLVVYNVEEYRGGVLIGTSQREMSILVQTCTNTPANGPITSATSGTIVDSTHYEICQNTGTFAISVKPTEANPANNIKITASSLPAGSTFSVTGDSTNAPVGTLSWTSTGVTPGTYTFYLYFLDDNCPIAGTNSVGYNILIAPTPVIYGTTTVCAQSTTTLSNSVSGGTWSSANTNIATVNASSGVVMGINTGTTTLTTNISYTSPSGCSTSTTLAVNPLPAPITGNTVVCVGSSATLSDANTGGVWSSSNSAIATISSSGGTYQGLTGPGTAIISYTLGGCSNTTTVTVNTSPGAITGTNTVCAGLTTNLSDVSTGGTWTSSNTFASVNSSGVVTGLAAGSSVISYATGASCVSTITVTVTASPAAITPAAATSVCIGTTTTLSDATPGGAWTSSTTSVATINNATRVVTGVSAGSTNITYAIGSCYVTTTVTVNTSPTAILPNPASVCAGGATTTISDGVTGGGWSTANTSIATVDPISGVVTGVTNGTAIITYGVGTCTVTSTVTVNAVPAAITPAAATSLCIGTTVTLSDATAGGAWTSSNTAVATINNATRVVTAVSVGATNITYTSAGCFVTKTVTVNTSPTAILPNPASVCAGGAITTVSDGVTGGAWSTANTSVATIDPVTGIVTGVTNGTAILTYAVGTCNVTSTLTVNPVPVTITPAGPTSLCVGTTVTLSDATAGGVWTSGNTTVANVNSATRIVTGASVGTAEITYSVGGCFTTTTVNVNTSPTAILPNPASVCAGSNVTISDGVSGGAWSTANTTIATINALSGIVTGVAQGTAVITYSVGTCTVSSSVTVNAVPSAITPATPVTICVGTTTALTDATTGGVWTSSNLSEATVSSSGIVSGVSSGSPIITYTNSGCFAVKTVVVSTAPTPIIPTPASGCVAYTTALSDAVSGGAWSIINTALATVDPVSGILSGIATGTTTVIYSIGTCTISAALTINLAPTAGTISGADNVCVGGGTIMLSDSQGGGVWSSGSPSVATITSAGVVTGVSSGTSVISYSVTNGCGTAVATYSVVVNNTSGGGAITGPSTICAGTYATLTESVSGGVWSASTANATVNATGLLTGVSPGPEIITYTITNACGVFTATKSIPIGAFLTAGSISGATSLCAGTTIPLSDGAVGGLWSSTNLPVATVSGTGVVSGVSGGTTVISYLMISGCGSAVATYTVAVSPLPAAGTISGPSTICAGSVVMLSDAVTGGSWSSANVAVATITAGGQVTGVGAGTAIISYTLTNACGSVAAVQLISVSGASAIGGITGPSSVCTGNTISLTNATPGGVWSASNASATISGAGLVSGITAGTDTIAYTLTLACGTVSATKIIAVNPTVSAGTISGLSTVCVSSIISLSDAVSGGAWSASNGNATITGGGIVTGINPGTDTISYSFSGSCAIAATKIISITPSSGAGTITGATTGCPGTTITLSDAVGGGVWSTTNNSVATVSVSGAVTTIAVGVDTVLYTVTGSCGTNVAYHTLAISPVPDAGTISAAATTMCTGSSVSLTDAAAGGVWSAANGNATVTGGLVTGVTPGNDVISYTVSNGCGTAVATQTVSVVTFPSVTPISGPSTVCVGTTITLMEGVPGGVWSATNLNAIVSSVGVVTGVNVGTDIITYILSNACGTVGAAANITINPAGNPGTITGPDSVCLGTTITLVDLTAGGVWSTGNTNASVSSGVVSGIAAGTVPVSYSVTGSCGIVSAVQIITVVATPYAGTITGPSSVCVSSGITLADTAPGGVWLSNSSNATILAPGIVNGAAAGVDTIFYLVNNLCGAAVANHPIVVNPVPAMTAISGPTNQCVGTLINLIDATTGGVWSSSNSSVAAINATTGAILGMNAGAVSIAYTVTNVFGCPASAAYADTVNAVPSSSPVSGGSQVCVGSSVALSDAAAGGVWGSSNALVATVNAAGVVTGVAAGTATISYAVTNSCGTATVTTTETVNPLPVISPVSGTSSLCAGTSTTLNDATPGGVWSSNNTSVAVVGASSGIVTAVNTGTTNIIYTVTNAYGCSAAAITAETINGVPSVNAVTGIANACVGSTSILSDATSGGVWSSNYTSIATVDPVSGIVYGVAGGVATLSYTITNASGCGASVTIPFAVGTAPVATPVTGVMSVCVGGVTTLSNATLGGAWTNSTGNATVSPTGVVTGVNAGTENITYTVSNSCGSVSNVAVVTVNGLPVVNTITASGTTICSGNSVALIETTSGGVWSINNTAIATVSSTGVVTGVATGTVTVVYSVNNASGCTGTASIVITVSNIGAATVSPVGTATICHGNPVAMNVTIAGGGITYQWLLGTNPISGATNASYSADTSGAYSVIIGNGICSETLTGVVVANAPNPVISLNPPDMLYTGSFTSYQWYINGVALPGDTSGIIYETVPGDYTVVVTDQNGCIDTSAAFASLSINSVNAALDIKVYPNPANAMLNIDAPLKVNVTVLSIDGKLLMSQKDAVNIDVHELANGMYIIMIYDQDNTLLKTVKFAKSE